MRPPRPTARELDLRREVDRLHARVCILNRELENREGAVGRLEVLLRERLRKIDDLNGKLEQARAQNQKLDDENERLVEMVRLPPLQSLT